MLKMALSIFIAILIIKTRKIWDSLVHIMLYLHGVTININGTTTKIKCHRGLIQNLAQKEKFSLFIFFSFFLFYFYSTDHIWIFFFKGSDLNFFSKLKKSKTREEKEEEMEDLALIPI